MTVFTMSVHPYLGDLNSDEPLIDCTVTPASTVERPYGTVISPDVFTKLRMFREVGCTEADNDLIRHLASRSQKAVHQPPSSAAQL